RMSLRTGSAKISSASSISPTVLASRVVTWAFIASVLLLLDRSLSRRSAATQRRRERHPLGNRPLDRVAHQHITALGPRHCAAHHDQPALGVGGHNLQVERRYPAIAHVTGHLLALEHLAGILAVTGRTVAAMRDRHAVRRAQ